MRASQPPRCILSRPVLLLLRLLFFSLFLPLCLLLCCCYADLIELLERCICAGSVGEEHGIGGVLLDGLRELLDGFRKISLSEGLIAASLGSEGLSAAQQRESGERAAPDEPPVLPSTMHHPLALAPSASPLTSSFDMLMSAGWGGGCFVLGKCERLQRKGQSFWTSRVFLGFC